MVVKRIEITYEGGHKEIIQYTARYDKDADGIVRFGFYDKRIEVNTNRVLQMREL
jgi:hypothetical protein